MGKGASSLTHALCTSTNSLSVQGHISLPCAQSRRNGFATAMWADWAFRTNWRGAQLFADACSNLWSMAAGGYARNCRNGRPGAGSRKKNRPLAMQTLWSSWQITDVLIWPCTCTQQSLWSIVPHPRTANSCWHNDDASNLFDGKKHHIVPCQGLSCKQYFRFSQATSFDKRLCCILDAAIACKCSEILGHKCIATVKICSTANRRQEFVKPAMILCKSCLYEYRKRPPV